MVKGHQRRKCILLKVKLRGRPTVAVIKRWPTNTGPNTCYGDLDPLYYRGWPAYRVTTIDWFQCMYRRIHVIVILFQPTMCTYSYTEYNIVSPLLVVRRVVPE